jgi:DNA-directed RNA polymerase specialized sigma24 family protein
VFVNLRYFEGCTIAEIAEVLGLERESVRRIGRGAIKALERMLRD